MSHAVNEMCTQDKNEIMDLIFTEQRPHKGLRPVAITKVQGSNFFPCHRNSYDGYFIDVMYADGFYEIWFAVFGDFDSYNWFLERIR